MRTIIITTMVSCSMLLSYSLWGQIKVQSNGNTGIGTANPAYKLEVSGTTRLGGYVGINGPPSCCYPLMVSSAYGQILMFDPSSAANGGIIGSTSDRINFWYDPSTGYNRVYAQQFNTSSDLSIKRNISTLPDGAISKIKQLRPVCFKFKDEPDSYNDGKFSLGLIAQEVESVIPEAVSLNEIEDIRLIDYDMLVSVLIKAVQEQQSLIENLTSEL